MIEGFVQDYIHDVPMGVAFNSATLSNFPKKPCGVWVSPCKWYTIREVKKGEWSLYPESNNNSKKQVWLYWEKYAPDCWNKSLKELEEVYNKMIKETNE